MNRFWSKVDRTGGDDACWLWQGAISTDGYGLFWLTKSRKAHRVAYELVKGEIPAGLTLDHLCRVRNCVNPDHLEPVSNYENLMRSPIAPAAVHARTTHCPQGHPYDEKNTRWYRGWRYCRTCTSKKTPR